MEPHSDIYTHCLRAKPSGTAPVLNIVSVARLPSNVQRCGGRSTAFGATPSLAASLSVEYTGESTMHGNEPASLPASAIAVTGVSLKRLAAVACVVALPERSYMTAAFEGQPWNVLPFGRDGVWGLQLYDRSMPHRTGSTREGLVRGSVESCQKSVGSMTESCEERWQSFQLSRRRRG